MAACQTCNACDGALVECVPLSGVEGAHLMLSAPERPCTPYLWLKRHGEAHATLVTPVAETGLTTI